MTQLTVHYECIFLAYRSPIKVTFHFPTSKRSKETAAAAAATFTAGGDNLLNYEGYYMHKKIYKTTLFYKTNLVDYAEREGAICMRASLHLLAHLKALAGGCVLDADQTVSRLTGTENTIVE